MTIGQYLQPTHKHYPVAEYITPEQFRIYREIGLKKGFKEVESAPLYVLPIMQKNILNLKANPQTYFISYLL